MPGLAALASTRLCLSANLTEYRLTRCFSQCCLSCREISGHFGSSAMPVMESCIDALAGDRAGGSVWCLWVSGGRQGVRRRHKLTMSAWMTSSDVSQIMEKGHSLWSQHSSFCVSHGAGAAMDAT